MSEIITVDQFMDRIKEDYPNLSRQLKTIASDIERNRTSLMLARVSDIAERCDVQPSAIVRFAKHFGFSGFTEMQSIFREAYTAESTPTLNYQQRVRELINNKSPHLQAGSIAREFIAASRSGLDELSAKLNDETFDAAIDMLVNAENIYVIGMRRSFPIASYFAYALGHTSKRVHLISGMGGMFRETMRSIGPNDVFVAISFRPYSRETQLCLRMAHHQKAKSLVITDSQLSPLARYASVLLPVDETGAFAFRSLTNVMCLSQALFIALAYKLELHVEETKEPETFSDE
jgi:DNA-binding MurR/RpiR family transcriptional regulator